MTTLLQLDHDTTSLQEHSYSFAIDIPNRVGYLNYSSFHCSLKLSKNNNYMLVFCFCLLVCFLFPTEYFSTAKSQLFFIISSPYYVQFGDLSRRHSILQLIPDNCLEQQLHGKGKYLIFSHMLRKQSMSYIGMLII